MARFARQKFFFDILCQKVYFGSKISKNFGPDGPKFWAICWCHLHMQFIACRCRFLPSRKKNACQSGILPSMKNIALRWKPRAIFCLATCNILHRHAISTYVVTTMKSKIFFRQNATNWNSKFSGKKWHTKEKCFAYSLDYQGTVHEEVLTLLLSKPKLLSINYYIEIPFGQ